MAKSIKLKNNNYIDSTSIVHNRQLLEEILTQYVLYNNSNGSKSTIQLNDNLSNYKYIEIFYKSNCGRFRSVKIDNPNGKYVDLTIIDSNYVAGLIWVKQNMVILRNNTITPDNYAWKEIDGISGTGYAQENCIFITKVLGYK